MMKLASNSYHHVELQLLGEFDPSSRRSDTGDPRHTYTDGHLYIYIYIYARMNVNITSS